MIGAIKGNFGATLLDLKRQEEAEPLLIDGFRIIRKVLPETDPRIAVPKQRLERLYREWKKPGRLAEALRPDAQ